MKKAPKLHLLKNVDKGVMYCGSRLEQNPDINYTTLANNKFLKSEDACEECKKGYKANSPFVPSAAKTARWDGRKPEHNDKKVVSK